MEKMQQKVQIKLASSKMRVSSKPPPIIRQIDLKNNNSFNNMGFLLQSQNQKQNYKFHQKPFSGNPSNKFNMVANNKFKFNQLRSAKATRDINTANHYKGKLIEDASYKVHYKNILNFYNVKSNSKISNPLIGNSLTKSVKLKVKSAKGLHINKPKTFNSKIVLNGGMKRNISPEMKNNKMLIKAINLSPSHKQSSRIISYTEFAYKEEKNLEYRKQMEDFHTIIENFTNDETKSYFAIFDGHNGANPALYCKENLHNILARSLTQTNYNIDKSFQYSFNKISQEINSKFQQKDTGTTATVLLIQQEDHHKVIYCANVGDSKCYLIKKNGTSIQISKDHKCSEEEEVSRVKSSGGIVFGGRVFGTLMLTRSIGDMEMKNYGVIATPSVNRTVITEEDAYVVLASDGVWDVVNPEGLSIIGKKNESAEKSCNAIVKMAMDGGTRDNVSCIVVKL